MATRVAATAFILHVERFCSDVAAGCPVELLGEHFGTLRAPAYGATDAECFEQQKGVLNAQ